MIDNKIFQLAKEKPAVFWIFSIVLIPIVLLLIFKEALMVLVVSKANQTKAEAELKDAALKTALGSYKDRAKAEQEKTKLPVDQDWHKK